MWMLNTGSLTQDFTFHAAHAKIRKVVRALPNRCVCLSSNVYCFANLNLPGLTLDQVFSGRLSRLNFSIYIYICIQSYGRLLSLRSSNPRQLSRFAKLEFHSIHSREELHADTRV